MQQDVLLDLLGLTTDYIIQTQYITLYHNTLHYHIATSLLYLYAPMKLQTIALYGSVIALIAFGLTRILSFYLIPFESYSSYFAFFAFLAISCIVLPLQYPNIFADSPQFLASVSAPSPAPSPLIPIVTNPTTAPVASVTPAA